MEAVDGNAIGGLLHEVFGSEMTDARQRLRNLRRRPARSPSSRSTCAAPGTVVRCRSCDNVLMVFVKIHDRTCVDLLGLAALG